MGEPTSTTVRVDGLRTRPAPPTDRDRTLAGSIPPAVLLKVTVAAAYVAAAVVGFRLAFVAEQVTTVWAPTGIALAALLAGSLRLWPAVWVGALLANVGSDAPAWTAFVIATGNTLEAITAVWWLRRLPHFDYTLRRVADVLAFVLIAAVACTAISARQLVELHGGTIHASSPGLGQGATFTITLPCVDGHEAATPAPSGGHVHPGCP